MYRSIFNDVFGPVMVGASSGGFGGPNRIGNLCRSLCGGTPEKLKVSYAEGSSKAFARINFGSDIGFLSGILGHSADSLLVNTSLQEAEGLGMEYSFVVEPIPEYAELQITSQEENDVPEVICIAMDRKGKHTEVLADSIGGGAIRIFAVDHFPVSKMEGDAFALLVFSFELLKPEEILGCIQFDNSHIIDTESISHKNEFLTIIYSEVPFQKINLLYSISGVRNVLTSDAVLPIVTPVKVEPQLFKTIEEFNHLSEKEGVDCADIAILYEMRRSGLPKEILFEKMRYIWRVMIGTIEKGLVGDVEQGENPFNYLFANQYCQRISQGKALTDGVLSACILNTIASFEGIADKNTITVAGPAAGAPVIIGSSVDVVSKHLKKSEDEIIKALFVAAAYGLIAYIKSNPTAEVTGCSGESGIGSAMAAAAIAYLSGGSLKEIDNAAGTAIMNMLGIGCDPVAGGVCGAPCRSRSTFAAINAIVSAELSLAGYRNYVCYDQMIDTMDSMFRELPEYMKGRGNGGVNLCPDSCRIMNEFMEWQKRKS